MRVALLILVACLVAGCGAARNGAGDVPISADPGLIVIAGVLEPGARHPPIDNYALRPDGTGIRKLAFSSNNWDLGFSADGRFVSMTVTTPDDKSLLVVSRVDGSERHVVSLPKNSVVVSPSLSPDGKRVAVGYAPDWDLVTDLWTITVDGRGLKQLSKTGGVLSVDWSPDGTRIAFVDGSRFESTSGGALTDIYVVRADGSELHRIATGFDGIGREVVWSPDGKRIAFQDAKQRLSIVDADGKNVDVLAPNGQAPAWSPDGKRLAFLRVASCPGYVACTRSRIFIVDVDGGTPRAVGPKFGDPMSLSWTTATLEPTPAGSKIGSPPSS